MLLASPLVAGVVFEIETTDHDASPPKVESTQVQAEGKNLKMGIAPGDRGGRGGTVLFRGDRRELVVVDHDDKSYMVIDQEALRQIGEQLAGVNDQIAEALKNVPEEQRAMVEKMMKERMPQQAVKRPAIDVRKTGDRGEKNGYPCVKYEVLRDGRKIRELWVTDWGNVEGGDEVADSFRSMAEFMKQFLDQLPAGGAPGGLGDDVFSQLSELPGFPVVTRELDDDGSLESESSLRSSRRQALDPAEFEPPAGYKRRSMFGG
jgi:hypothetical protein